MTLNQLTISELTARLAKREVSAREAMQACLDQIQHVDKDVRAFLSFDEADALTQADAADHALAAGQSHAQRPLLGVPLAIKDVIAVKGQPLNCGSKILGRFVSPYDATVIEKLKAAEAVAIPEWLEYGVISGLSREMREKLERVRPGTIGQASRIPGITPAALSLVHVSIRLQGQRRAAAS